MSRPTGLTLREAIEGSLRLDVDEVPGEPMTPAPFQAHSSTSREAARRIEPKAGTLRARVLEAFRAELAGAGRMEVFEPGFTDEELQAVLGLDGSTERPRRVELVVAGWLRDSGRTRPTRGGSPATVWELVPEAER